MMINYHLEGLPVTEVVSLSSPKEMLVHVLTVWQHFIVLLST